MGHSLQAPWALQAPWGLHCGGPRCRVHRQGFPPAMCTSSIRGKCSEEPRGPQGSEEGDIGRVQPTLDFPRPPTLPGPWREMRVLLALGQRPCWMKPVSCSSLCSRKCCRLHPDGAVGVNSCVRLSPSNTPRPTLKSRGWGAPHAVLSRGLGHPRVPAAAHPMPAPLAAGRKQAHEAAQLRRRPSWTTGRGESAGGGRACAPM